MFARSVIRERITNFLVYVLHAHTFLHKIHLFTQKDKIKFVSCLLSDDIFLENIFQSPLKPSFVNTIFFKVLLICLSKIDDAWGKKSIFILKNLNHLPNYLSNTYSPCVCVINQCTLIEKRSSYTIYFITNAIFLLSRDHPYKLFEQTSQ